MPSVCCDFGNPRSLNCVSLTKSVPFEPNQIKLRFDHFWHFLKLPLFKWLWLLNLPSLVWFVLDISFLSDNSQPFSKVVLCKYWQAFMMVKLKIEQGLLMEGTKKNKEYFLKKHIFWALPKWDKSTQTSKSTQCQGTLYPKQCLYFCQVSQTHLIMN